MFDISLSVEMSNSNTYYSQSRRLTLEQQTMEVYKAIEEKMNTAADKRDENIKKMLERLREHVSHTRHFYNSHIRI